MSTKVIMPQMGESIFEGTITKWLKKTGESVTRDEPLFEISTDKVDSEIPAPASGILSQILVPEGKTVQINTVVAVIEAADESGVKADVKKEIIQAVAVSPPPAAIPSPVTTAAFPPSTEEQAIAPDATSAEKEGTKKPAAPAPIVQPRDIRTSPLVRRLARENNIDLSMVRGTGLEGRVTKEDVLNYIEQTKEVPAIPSSTVALKTEKPDTPAEKAPEVAPISIVREPAVVETAVQLPRFVGEVESVPMTPMRKSIAEHMVMSKRTSAHVSTVFEVDMSSIVSLRERHKADFEKREGINLTFTPFFIKALVDTVRDFPILNCSISGDNIVYKKPINVGIAVALDAGLIVPVIKDAQLKSFTGLALAINDLALRARSKRLKPEEVQNGTITVTNPGIHGSLFGTPIISQPQVAILGIGGIEKRPVVVNDAIAIRSMVFLSLSFDHRVIDGAVADQCMASLKARLQSWAQWID